MMERSRLKKPEREGMSLAESIPQEELPKVAPEHVWLNNKQD